MKNLAHWCLENWFTTLSVLVYVIANVVPRPSGASHSGAGKVFWEIIDRLCVLTSHGLPGTLKMPLTKTQMPSEAVVASVSEATQVKLKSKGKARVRVDPYESEVAVVQAVPTPEPVATPNRKTKKPANKPAKKGHKA